MAVSLTPRPADLLTEDSSISSSTDSTSTDLRNFDHTHNNHSSIGSTQGNSGSSTLDTWSCL